MHICFSAGAYPTKDRPYASFVASLCEQFALLGHRITVVCPQSITKSFLRRQSLDPYYTKIDKGKGTIEIYRPRSFTCGESRLLGRLTLLANRWTVNRMIRKKIIIPDVFYAHFWISAFNVMFSAKRLNIPLFVATGEDIITIQNYLTKQEVLLLQAMVKGVVCVSTKNKNESVSLHLARPNMCVVLPNSVDTTKFFPVDKLLLRDSLNIRADDFVVVYVGRFVDRKGSRRVSKAIEELNDESIKSIFIGSNLSDQKIDYSPNCPGIVFCGKLSHEEIPIYLNCADVFVLPTLAEGCSNSIVEAMACGLPIISSDLDFNYDILDETNSILITPLDIAAIASSIRFLKENPTIRHKMSLASLEKAKDLDLAKRAHKILNFMIEKMDYAGKIL